MTHSMKRLLFLLLILISFNLSYAESSSVAIFVYNTDNSIPTNALRSQLTTSFLEGGNSTYDVLDRTDEILSYLQQEFKYQGSGLVRDDQLTSIGEHFGANYIFVVAITHYPQYNQYFFEGKIIDISTRKVIKNAQYPNDNNTIVESMDPQSQMRVGRELAKQLDLYSTAQLVQQQQQKQQQAEAEKILKIGDIYKTDRYHSWRIGYLDGTNKHGIAYRVDSKSGHPASSLYLIDKEKTPTCAQLLLLYSNRKVLGLYGEYWSNDLAKKMKNGWGDWSDDWYYTINFSNGKKEQRRTNQKTQYESIIIIEF